MTVSAGSEQRAHVAVARQPILDRAEEVTGHELLYRSTRSVGAAPDAEGATSKVIVRALADIGLDRLVGDKLAWVNVTREFLLGVRPLPLPPERVMLELLEGQEVDARLLDVLAELRESGFRIALDDFRFDHGWEQLLEHADAVKLDVRELGLGPALEEAIARLRPWDVTLLAEKVETRAEYDACRALGFDRFQGYFFAQPLLVEGDAVPTHRVAGLTALARAGQATTFEELERLITQDAGLAYKLVRLANSAFVGARGRVTSVRGVLARMGSVNVRRWAMLLSLAGLTDRPQHLLATGLLRARQCELLAAPPADPACAFTAGLFSILDALLGTPMPELLAGLPFDARVPDAILDHSGPEGPLLAAVLAYERGDFDAVPDLAAVAAAYRDALDWVERAAPHLP
jgi:EAL and modified HD-GYP domain-containing signal transduction protein